jgi:hypothetical protein
MTGFLRRIVLIGLLLLGTVPSWAQFYNGSHMQFGKNRVQYNGFTWMSQNYERFKIYYSMGGKTHAAYVAQSAHQQLQEVEKMFDFFIEDKIEFIVYNSQTQFRQSNVGITGDEAYNIGGVTRMVGNKVFLYYEGDHKKLDRQIRAGIATVLVNQMMYGANWRDVLKNSALLTLPDWYLQGFVSYVSEPWSVETEGYVKDGVTNGKYDRFYRLEGIHAQYAGHAMWNYIVEVYGQAVVPNILYMTRISRNVESGFVFVIGAGLRKLSSDYVAYYKMKFSDDAKVLQQPALDEISLKNKKNIVVQQFRISPDGKKAAWVTNQMGQYKVYIQDLETGDRKRILKGEQKLNRINDYSHPVLGWHPTGQGLAYVVEKKGEVWFCLYSLEDGSTSRKPLGKVDKVLSFDYSDDGKSAVFSAVSNGQTDLFLYRPTANALEQLTDDIFDDLHPKFIHKSSAVIFASNRNSDTLKKDVKVKPYNNTKDIFVLPLKDRVRVLKRITQTPNADETWPSQLDTMNYTFLSDENGIINRYAAIYDSAIAYVDTVVHYRYFTTTAPLSNFNNNILEYDMNEKRGTYSLLMLHEGSYRFYTGRIKNDQRYTGTLPNTRYRVQQRLAQLRALKTNNPDSVKREQVKLQVTEQREKPDSGLIDINNYIFSDESPAFEKETIKITETKENKKDKQDTLKPKKKPEDEFTPAPFAQYRRNFSTDQIVSQLDNNYLNQAYQRYIPGVGYFNPGVNILMKVGITDVFEDYRIIGGFRLAGNMGSNEMMLTYMDNSKQIDKQWVAYRQTFNNISRDLGFTKNYIHDLKFIAKYPFNEVLSLRGTINYRNDRIVTAATDRFNLEKENTHEHMVGSKLELVFDNVIPKGLNLYNGMRFKVWAEYYRQIITEESNFIVTGFDFRFYQKIHRDFIFAARAAGSASLGNRRLLYYLGGVDNWIAPRFDRNIQVAPNQNYGFQTIATPVRGFYQNARNGSNFGVVNAELRMPLIKYFAEKPLKSDFLENFQVVGFFDVGSAWTGPNPYSDENAFNTIQYQTVGNPIIITIKNQREPIIYGYGWGLRSKLFGYFLRFDWAWGVDDGLRLAPVRYFSLTLDF